MRNIFSERGLVTELLDRLRRLEELYTILADRQTVKASYTVEEVSKIICRSKFCVREYCRKGRVHATKAACGRGRSREWRISHQELQRLRNEGLLPLPEKSSTDGRAAF
jgi:transposase